MITWPGLWSGGPSRGLVDLVVLIAARSCPLGIDVARLTSDPSAIGTSAPLESLEPA